MKPRPSMPETAMVACDAMPWILIVDDGGRPRRLVVEPGAQVLGTDPGVDLVVDHPTVSRRHASLEGDDEGVWLRDLGSSNGTRVDGTRVRGRLLVTPSHTVHFGSLACRFQPADARELEPAVVFGSTPADAADERPDAPVATLSVGSVRDFVLGALPGLITALERRRAADRHDRDEHRDRGLAFVHDAGRALVDAFPCRRLEIVDRSADESTAGPAVLFRAGEPTADECANGEGSDDEPTVVAAGGLETRIVLPPGHDSRGILPLVELVTRLVALEYEPAGPSTPPPPADDEPPLPRPATVDPTMQQLYDDARRVARGDIGVLISGESGTGKEVLAQFVHACSPRAEGDLVALNCAALPQDLLEAELFGIERGVATGVDARPGRFEQAHGGTLFLDEIGDMAPATQAKILRVLQEGEVFRLGGRTPRPASVRVIAATNRDLDRMIQDGDFRRDLYHRIADSRFTLPPLRERLADLPNLAAHFLEGATAGRGVAVRGISRAALDALVAFSWPGNVRQLEREMARAALFLEPGDLLQSRHLHDEVATGGHEASNAPRTLKARLERHERGVVTETLMRHDGNVRAAAAELGIGRTTLYRRLKELGIEHG